MDSRKGGWFTTKEQSGGGPLIDLGVHMIDLTRLAYGERSAGIRERMHLFKIPPTAAIYRILSILPSGTQRRMGSSMWRISPRDLSALKTARACRLNSRGHRISSRNSFLSS
ncbi:MAG: hypothetical protein ACLR23_23460 [Clostridia bacterium]